jgi:hypothetical protein
MINLMPIEEKKKMRNNFFSRLLVAVFFMFGFLGFIAAVAILPSFFVSYAKKQTVARNLEIQKNQKMPEVDQQAQMAVTDLNNKLGLIEKAMNNKYVFSQKIVNEILSRQTDGIKITKIFYENDPFKGKKIALSGVAGSREQLLQFRQAFESSNVFSNVNLPISNFVKGQNIQFNLELTAL